MALFVEQMKWYHLWHILFLILSKVKQEQNGAFGWLIIVLVKIKPPFIMDRDKERKEEREGGKDKERGREWEREGKEASMHE